MGTQSLLAPSSMTSPNVLYYLRGEKKAGLGLLPTHSIWEDVSMETKATELGTKDTKVMREGERKGEPISVPDSGVWLFALC